MKSARLSHKSSSGSCLDVTPAVRSPARALSGNYASRPHNGSPHTAVTCSTHLGQHSHHDRCIERKEALNPEMSTPSGEGACASQISNYRTSTATGASEKGGEGMPWARAVPVAAQCCSPSPVPAAECRAAGRRCASAASPGGASPAKTMVLVNERKHTFGSFPAPVRNDLMT